MAAKLNVALTTKLGGEDVLSAIGLFDGDLLGPLKGCKGFGNKGGNARTHASTGINFLAFANRTNRQVGDGFHVFVAFGGQTNHEVGLHMIPAPAVGLGRHVEQLFVGNKFVNNRAHAGGRRFRRKGQPTAPHAGHHVRQLYGIRIEAQ